MQFKPHDYQEYAIQRIIDTKSIGLFLDMGLGKTVSTLTALNELMYNYFEVGKVLIIAPLRVAKSTWSDEIEKWDHLKDLTYSKVLGSPANRIAALKKDADIYLINRENVKWIVEFYKNAWPFDVVVIDELSSFKSSKSQRFKYLKKVIPLTNRVIGLTGTPTPNGFLDLWSQIYLLDRGQRLGGTLKKYRDRYFEVGDRNYQTGMIYNYVLREGAEQNILKRLEDITVSMEAKDFLDMPDKIDNIVNIELSTKEIKEYNKLERDSILELNEDVITASSAAVVTQKLLQYTSGAIYDEDKKVVKVHDKKLEALEDIVEFNEGKPILVFYNFKHDLDRIKKRFGYLNPKTLDTEEDIKAWNEGRINLLLCHPASAGHGLNLQSGGHIIVWFSLTWSLELYQQANARLHRQSQKHNVIVHHLICKNTVDETVMEALKNKVKVQDLLMDYLKAKIDEPVKEVK